MDKEVYFSSDDVKLIQYSEKSVAIFSNKEWGIQNKDNLKEFSGRYNPNLTLDDKKTPGWIFGNKKKDDILNYLNGNTNNQTKGNESKHDSSLLIKIEKLERKIEKLERKFENLECDVENLSGKIDDL